MWLKWRRQKIITAWRDALNLEQHKRVFHQLYDQIDGFSLSKAARKNQDAMEFVYGEIDFEAFIALLSLCNPDENTIFHDLGSGTGKAVIACAMVYPIQKCCGIELFPTLHGCAEQVQNQLALLPEYTHKAEKITFIQENILHFALPDATLVYINATSFFGELWLQLSRHLEQLQINSLVISTSKPLMSSLFHIQKKTRVQMSWGIVDAFIQQRSADSP